MSEACCGTRLNPSCGGRPRSTGAVGRRGTAKIRGKPVWRQLPGRKHWV